MSLTTTDPAFILVSDHALLVEFDASSDGGLERGANESVVGLDQAIAGAPIDGVTEVVPAIINLLVMFDPLSTDHEAVEAEVRARLTIPTTQRPAATTHEIAVCYEETFASDLAAVAASSGLSVEAVIATHLEGDYRVTMYGFVPGYAYLDGVPEVIRVPRKQSAVRGIDAGSVLITGRQCLVTTMVMPTGWSIIGRSPTPILLADPDRPFRFDPGDRIRFNRVDLAEFTRLEAQR